MANVLSIVSYKIFPAKMGGQKGIASFNEYFSKYHALFCVTVEDNLPAYASYQIINVLRNRPVRYINIFYFIFICRMYRILLFIYFLPPSKERLIRLKRSAFAPKITG